jgi:hypothetical protein
MISIVIRRKGLAAIFIVAECLHAFKCFRVLSSNVIPTLKPYPFFYPKFFPSFLTLNWGQNLFYTIFLKLKTTSIFTLFSYKVNHSRASYQKFLLFSNTKNIYTYTSFSKNTQKHLLFQIYFQKHQKTFLSSNILNTNTWILNQVTF